MLRANWDSYKYVGVVKVHLKMHASPTRGFKYNITSIMLVSHCTHHQDMGNGKAKLNEHENQNIYN